MSGKVPSVWLPAPSEGVFVVAPVNGFVVNWGAKYLFKAFTALRQSDVGHYLWLPPLCLDAGALLFGDLATRLRHSPPRMLYACAMLLSSCIALLPLAATPWQATAIASISLAGGGALYTLCTADLLSRVPDVAVSFAGSTLAASQSLAIIISGPLIGAAVQAYGAYDVPAIVLGACVIPGSLIWIAWRPAPRPAQV